MPQTSYTEVNLAKLMSLSEQLGATKKLQVLLFCLQQLNEQGEVQIPVSQTAQQLGCAREHVSRVLTDLETKGVFQRVGTVGTPGRKGRRFRVCPGFVRH